MIASAPGVAEGHGADEGAEADPARLPGQRGQRDPRVRRTGQAGTVALHHVVIGSEERVESAFLRPPRHREQIVVRGTLLRFGEDPQLHAATLSALSVADAIVEQDKTAVDHCRAGEAQIDIG